jgi:hypothetical protein
VCKEDFIHYEILNSCQPSTQEARMLAQTVTENNFTYILHCKEKEDENNCKTCMLYFELYADANDNNYMRCRQ